MVTFDHYKKSGFPDIAEVPYEWTLGAVKNVFDVICGATPSEHEENWGGEIPWVGPADMPMFGRIASGKRNITKTGYSSCGTTIVPAGSIVLSTRAPIGKICIANNELCTNQGCKCLVPKSNCNTQFYAYYLFAIIERLQMAGTGTTFKELSTANLKQMPIPIIPLSDQDSIVSYLDSRVREIDAITSEAKASIEEYKQWKASIIYEAVTKGLDLDAEMIDSGVEWIGKMPKGWKCTALKNLCSMQSGRNITSEQIADEGEYPVYGGNGIRGYYSEWNTEGEFLTVGRQGALCGNVHKVSGRVWATEHAVVTRPKDSVSLPYLYYNLVAMNLNQYASNTAAQPGLAVGVILTKQTIIPPVEEQQLIGKFLDKKCSAIDALIEEKELLISDLEAYKKSLIFEVVTGKRKVV